MKENSKIKNLNTVNASKEDDLLVLQSSNHPGLILISALLTDKNYISWRRAMRIALGAKNKLGFIDGKITIPEEGSKDYEKWKRCDYMVTSWLRNSIARELVRGFLYNTTVKELWDEIAERFSDSNRPMIYQIKRKMASISQENLSVTNYYSKLKQLWDELASIEALPPCTCGSMKLANDILNKDRLMQFLMGLNDSYDQVETQKEIQLNLIENIDSVALATKAQGPRKYDARKRHCDYCNLDGHTREGCFKLIGYPDWFKNRNKTTNQQA
ncbi:uncharacterized protein LOC131180568 [Hevea brasiliensis]|uniref:uncharacterized protein LOC131180568 n=1 Tax=Hevea brasiliensis TaxID=3981 RepID=UPI0025E5455F|nr:uncharacterized protein LOC131180568 [Hevea brasiliensis]